MPDPTKETVSATQIGALLNVSPYLTRWLLWRHFKHGDEIDAVSSGPNDRMEWGKRMQPVIIAAAAQEMNLEVVENFNDEYTRNPALRIGATLDGEFRDLNRGPGVLETKNVDWLVWRDNWTEDDAPDHIEAQLQAQMLATGHGWGTIACLVGGNDLRLYHRVPDPDLHATMIDAVNVFFNSLGANEEPDPLGRADELPLWRRTREYVEEPEPLDLTESRLAHELLAELNYWQGMKSMATKMEKERKAKLEVLAGTHSPVLAHGWAAWISHSDTKESVVTMPLDVRERLSELYARFDAGGCDLDQSEADAVRRAFAWKTITRQASKSCRIKINERPTLDDPPWADETELAVHL